LGHNFYFPKRRRFQEFIEVYIYLFLHFVKAYYCQSFKDEVAGSRNSAFFIDSCGIAERCVNHAENGSSGVEKRKKTPKNDSMKKSKAPQTKKNKGPKVAKTIKAPKIKKSRTKKTIKAPTGSPTSSLSPTDLPSSIPSSSPTKSEINSEPNTSVEIVIVMETRAPANFECTKQELTEFEGNVEAKLSTVLEAGDTASFKTSVVSVVASCEAVPSDRRLLEEDLKVKMLTTLSAENLGADDGEVKPTFSKLNKLTVESFSEILEVDPSSVESKAFLVTESPTMSPTAAPTAAPSVAPSPSPPPQDLGLRRIAEQMNDYYDISHSTDLNQDKKGPFEHAQDVEDIFMRDHNEFNNLSGGSDSVLSDVEGLDYYADLPDFVTQEDIDLLQCKCVDCDADEVCGGLWKGKRYPSQEKTKSEADNVTGRHLQRIHIVVSHCKSSLEWIDDYTRGYDVASVHIVSKCGEPVLGAPEISTVEVLPNVGRCDHSFAHYITSILEQKIHVEDEKDSIVVFLKDDMSSHNLHQSGYWNDFGSMIKIASSDNGFACGIIPGNVESGTYSFFLSAYHEVKTLIEFSMSKYSRNIKGYATDESEFESDYKTLGSWYVSLGTDLPETEIVQVCYGGMFAASVSNIMKRDMAIWKTLEKSLSRGSSIQEGHYAERSWASLLSKPLEPFQIEAMLTKSDGVYLNENSMHGALIRRPTLYLHVGVEGTSSTKLLTESLVIDIDKLKSDGYNVAVHGKWDAGVNGFPNIDRLASCMWSDINKSVFPEHLKEATICPQDLLPDLSEYMKNLADSSRNAVILNPWLVRPGTAMSLGLYFDPVWDVNVVIYYRRYYEWITIKFDTWREELFEHTLSPRKALIPFSSFRYIDFIRENCKRLFYGTNENKYGAPVRQLNRVLHHDGMEGMQQADGKVYSNQFDPVTNFQVEQLTDLKEYTYFVAQQYYAQSRFRHGIKIVNYHDIRGAETNFYCHVLHDAHNACKAAIERELSASEPLKMQHQTFAQLNPILPFKPAHALEEIVIAGYMEGRLQFDDTQSNKKFATQILLWIKMIHSALQERKFSVTDFPVECLYQFEIDKLLEVSFAYEKALLPGFFGSYKGADGMKQDFSQWRFCSVDSARVLSDSKWDFLFKDAIDYALPVYVY